MQEVDLYEPMCNWLKHYLEEKYKKGKVIVLDTHSERLDRVLHRYGINNSAAIGVDIQIDILGIVTNSDKTKLFFIEAKKNALTLRDLGQLWAYCKLIDPEEAFLLTPKDFGMLDKLINNYRREDILDFGDGKKIKKMKLAIWDIQTGSPQLETMIPKI